MADNLAEALLLGPDYLYPPGYENTRSVPWYIRTIELRRRLGSVREPWTAMQVYEVPRMGSFRQRVPVLRRAVLPVRAFTDQAVEKGLFDVRMMTSAYFRMTKADSTAFDSKCQRVLDAYKRGAIGRRDFQHSAIMRERAEPRRWDGPVRPAPNRAYMFDSYLPLSWHGGKSRALDGAMEELWSFAEDIATRHAHVDGWAEGWALPPDRLPRLWARDVRRRASQR